MVKSGLNYSLKIIDLLLSSKGEIQKKKAATLPGGLHILMNIQTKNYLHCQYPTTNGCLLNLVRQVL